MLFTLLILLFMQFISVLFFSIMPYIIRKTDSFGVSIPEQVFHDEAIAKMRRDYTLQSVIAGLVITVLMVPAVLKLPENLGLYLFLEAYVVQLLIFFVIYLIKHFQMKKLKAEKNYTREFKQFVVIDTSFRSKMIRVSPLWFILYAVVIFGTLIFTYYLYPSLPPRMPMHWDLNGNVNGWMEKSLMGVLYLPGTQLFISLVYILIFIVIKKSKQLLDPSKAVISIEQSRIFRYRWSAFIVFSGLLLVILFGLVQWFILTSMNNLKLMTVVILIPVFVIIVWAIVLSITTGQGGSNVKIKDKKSPKEKTISRNEDQFWVLGQYYYNPKDPALFVEKRFGIGWTFNFGRPLTWAIVIGFLVFIAAVMILAFVITGKQTVGK